MISSPVQFAMQQWPGQPVKAQYSNITRSSSHKVKIIQWTWFWSESEGWTVLDWSCCSSSSLASSRCQVTRVSQVIQTRSQSQDADEIWSGPDEDLLEYYELTNRRYEDFRSDSDYYQEELESPRAEAMVEVLEAEVKVGPSLGRVLGEWIIFRTCYFKNLFLYSGVGSIIIIIFYVLGMGFKLYKIWKGEYVEEEPVFLKYK